MCSRHTTKSLSGLWENVCVCVCMCVCACVRACVRVCVHVRTHVHALVYEHMHAHEWLCVTCMHMPITSKVEVLYTPLAFNLQPRLLFTENGEKSVQRTPHDFILHNRVKQCIHTHTHTHTYIYMNITTPSPQKVQPIFYWNQRSLVRAWALVDVQLEVLVLPEEAATHFIHRVVLLVLLRQQNLWNKRRPALQAFLHWPCSKATNTAILMCTKDAPMLC